MYYFQNLFNTALNGIDSGGATGGVLQVAQYILLAALMFGIFQAWAQGGDTQLLGVTGRRGRKEGTRSFSVLPASASSRWV
jgi:hypothetical protein